MRRPLCIWLAFALCLAVVLAAMAWISVAALRADQAERRMARQAAVEEQIRLALWRMDSALVPLIAQEAARPHFVYQPFHPVGAAYNRLYEQVAGEVILPSPLLTVDVPEVLVHFRLEPDGRLASPQVPTGQDRQLALDGYTTPDRIDQAARLLEELRPVLDRQVLLAGLPSPGPVTPAALPIARLQRPAQPPAQADQQVAAQNLTRLQQQKGQRALARDEVAELLNTTAAMARQKANDQAQQMQGQQYNPALSPAAVAEGALRPVWMGDALLLARRVNVGGQEHIVGCRLNWPHIRAALLKDSADLLPGAALLAARQGPPAGNYALAALPVRLEPGEVPVDLAGAGPPIPLPLAIAWACVLAAAAAVGILLGKAVSLSERRGAFVSAVTHELRTPLTTFRLYADMLAEGMVRDEAKRTSYLRRLRDEADRLSHLVENVLAYARLSGPRSAGAMEAVELGSLVERSRDRLAALTERAGMSLEVEVEPSAGPRPVRCNASAVEQVLLNLVDNACKYAGKAADRRIHLRAALSDGQAVLTVADHGPGIPPAERARLFRAFRKSARDAARSAPGIGLGLALSRRMARAMGGDLRCEPPAAAGPGASFALLLPADLIKGQRP